MIILEGIRRSGKSFTTDLLKNKIPNLVHYKDIGMRLINHNVVDSDYYAIGRDFAYAQFLPKLRWDTYFTKRLLFDRAYWSTYVYGQCWRDNLSKTFLKDHIHKVEEVYGDFLEQIKILFITLSEDDLKRIESMGRGKDQWDKTRDDYRQQYDLYMELFDISKVRTFTLDAFQDEKHILDVFNKVLNA